jgi:hypothetical protein
MLVYARPGYDCAHERKAWCLVVLNYAIHVVHFHEAAEPAKTMNIERKSGYGLNIRGVCIYLSCSKQSVQNQAAQ